MVGTHEVNKRSPKMRMELKPKGKTCGRLLLWWMVQVSTDVEKRHIDMERCDGNKTVRGQMKMETFI